MSKPLTATQIRCLSAGKFIVGGITGLYLKKSSKTSGFFYLRFSDSTGRHEISLGRHGETNNFPLLLPHRVIFAIPLFGQKVVSPVSMVVQNVRRLTLNFPEKLHSSAMRPAGRS